MTQDLIGTLETTAAESRCERCREWEQMGLSATCPSCDAIAFDMLMRAYRERFQNEVLVPILQRVLDATNKETGGE